MLHNIRDIQVLVTLLLALLVYGCAGTSTFHQVARGGDTVAIAAGWKHHFSKNNITVSITPDGGGGPVATYLPGASEIRAVTNFYPDPLSSIIVSRQTNQDLTFNAANYANTTGQFTKPTGSDISDNDWWQTVVFIDLPLGLVENVVYNIDISTPEGETATADVLVVAGAGTPHQFGADLELGSPFFLCDNEELLALKRVDHYIVRFDGAQTPHAIQIDLSHDPDVDNGGAGRAYVVNPLGYIKNVAWTDDGTNLRAILTPTRDSEITKMHDFKIYVAGGITNLNIVDVQAFDNTGNVVPGVTASLATE